jgi:hypothetical protein
MSDHVGFVVDEAEVGQVIPLRLIPELKIVCGVI